MEHKNAQNLRNSAGDFINIGSGQELTIKELAETIRVVVYKQELLNCEKSPDTVCPITWDTSKPNSTPRKLCDTFRLTVLGVLLCPWAFPSLGIPQLYHTFPLCPQKEVAPSGTRVFAFPRPVCYTLVKSRRMKLPIGIQTFIHKGPHDGTLKTRSFPARCFLNYAVLSF
jgi:hypothetical protein